MSRPLFDRALVRRRVKRALREIGAHRALFDYSAGQINERLSEIKRGFARPLDLSPLPFLNEGSDLSRADEEALPFEDQSFDLVVSNMGFHWVNDFPEALSQIKRVLKQDGLFMAAFAGEDSLHELRYSLVNAEVAICGGVSPRLSPTVSLADTSRLLLSAGFKLPVADKESVTLVYSDMFSLMRELRGMGQTNALHERLRTPTRRAVFAEAERIYRENFGMPDGTIPATFDILHLHGWK